MTYYRKMFSQNETVFHSEIRHIETCFIKGSVLHTDSKPASYWDIQQKDNLNSPDYIACGMDPCTALTDKVMTGMNIMISPTGTVLA